MHRRFGILTEEAVAPVIYGVAELLGTREGLKLSRPGIKAKISPPDRNGLGLRVRDTPDLTTAV